MLKSQTIAYDASTGSDTVMLKTNPSMRSTKVVALYVSLACYIPSLNKTDTSSQMPYLSWGLGLTEKDFEYR
jgi:hypothetical protein